MVGERYRAIAVHKMLGGGCINDVNQQPPQRSVCSLADSGWNGPERRQKARKRIAAVGLDQKEYSTSVATIRTTRACVSGVLHEFCRPSLAAKVCRGL
ncbi:unnamed protein product [Heligmosomoides polygyrus]|uniref:Uncharacterized protein n=1 Tax=Heligmosomoides polygyrus TaxID=6339 RepID=A0A183F2R0_HELPZ|nr:unnamed protein product [Heligmosomoides polygyrus]